MNWGLFLLLAGRVLPLALAVRLLASLGRLGREPANVVWPLRDYLLRDIGIVIVCLLLTYAACWSGG